MQDADVGQTKQTGQSEALKPITNLRPITVVNPNWRLISLRRHRLIIVITLIVSLGVIGILISLPNSQSCPVEVTAMRFEPSGIRDEHGQVYLLVTLSVTNRDAIRHWFGAGTNIEAKVANRWVQIGQPFNFGSLAPGKGTHELLLLPGNASACRLRMEHLSEHRDSRFLSLMGPGGRRLVSNSPILRKLLWPKQSKPMFPPGVRPALPEIVVEIELPQFDVLAWETLR